MLRVNSKIVFKDVEDQTVLINVESGLYYSLNTTGSFLFHLLLKNRDYSDILGRMCATYSLPEQRAKLELGEFLDALSDAHILKPSGK